MQNTENLSYTVTSEDCTRLGVNQAILLSHLLQLYSGEEIPEAEKLHKEMGFLTIPTIKKCISSLRKSGCVTGLKSKGSQKLKYVVTPSLSGKSLKKTKIKPDDSFKKKDEACTWFITTYASLYQNVFNELEVRHIMKDMTVEEAVTACKSIGYYVMKLSVTSDVKYMVSPVRFLKEKIYEKY